MEILSRIEWGARAPRRRTSISLPVKENWGHHTAGSEAGISGMRRIQNFHMDTRGWSDIGYSWVYDMHQRTWYEGRGWGISGAHTSGHNKIGHGFCIMGNFNNESFPDTAVEDFAKMIALGYELKKGPAELTGGHRDVGSTLCPGNNFYNRIPEINARIKEIIGGGGNMADEKYKDTTNPNFQAAWNWMIDNGVFSKYTEPTDSLTAEKFAVFFKRAVDQKVIG